MRVVCDNCGASYKIPESKLVKEVNKATCRKCGNAILIRRVTAPAKAAPTEGASPDERTQITSAADLERQARSRTGGYEENAAPAHAEAPQGEETVPRDDGPPQRRPAGASTDPGGAAAVPKPIPPMAPPKAPPARPPAAPVAALSSSSPTPAPARPPAMREGPVLSDERPAPIPPPVSALPPAQPAGAGKGDLLLTLAGVVVGFFGAAAVVAGAVLNTPVLGLVGVFLLLFCLMFMLILLVSGGFGQRPASKLGATAGGLFAGSLGAIAWFALWGFGALTPGEPVAETPPSLKVEPTQVAVAEPPPAPPPVEPPVAAPVPEPVVAPVPEPVPEPVVAAKVPEDPAAKAKAEEEARLKAEAKAEAKAKAEADAKAKAEAKAAAKAEAAEQARIAPTPKAEPTPAPTPTKTTTTSSGSSLSVQAVATMVNSNKSVKLCYLKEANRTGAVPHAKVKVTVTPTGKATKALAVGEHAGTEFGNCLSGAITAISFPPFEGETTTITYAN